MDLTLSDPLAGGLSDPGSFSFYNPADIPALPADIFTPSPIGNTAAPGDTLAANVANGVNSTGNPIFTGLQKTADLFSTLFGAVAQGANAYKTVTVPSALKPQNPIGQSQIPSLQGLSDPTGLLQSFANLGAALRTVFNPGGANTVTTTGTVASALPSILIIGVILIAGYFLLRSK